MVKNIGFLFNHDAMHQVAHIAPIIVCLRKIIPRIKIIAMVSSDSQLDRLRDIVELRSDSGLEIRMLEVPTSLKRIFKMLNTFAPVQRLYILGRYRAMFENLDCLIVPEMTSTRLKTLLGMKTTPLILLPHGAGDRAIGFGEEIKHFDYVLLSGTKVRDRMLRSGLIRRDNHSLIGYPKFDTIDSTKLGKLSYFGNSNPTVLYNPHFDPHLSSWYEMGIEVLEFFAERNDYNLILAPHVMLFKKRLHVSLQSGSFKFINSIPQRFLKCSNIKIDLGSKNCVNMEYILNADVYLGDVSSQVYEFLHKPRPCIFLNGHKANWFSDPNYQHWHCGTVLDKVSDLSEILNNLDSIHEHYRDIQIRSFSETFDLKSVPSSLRAAQSIVAFLDAQAALAA